MSLANSGDHGTRALLVDTGRTIGRAMSSLVTTLNPDAIVVGGTLGSLGEPVLRGIPDALDRYSQPAALHDPVVTGGAEFTPRRAAGSLWPSGSSKTLDQRLAVVRASREIRTRFKFGH
ncbi:hypothetical protein NE236_29645 [Actinoallomurus purpureus]|uniref:ROK family protein n=1 Tax=Actinoallomurus purpureus TaxID=478114 RepID=UPI002093CF90|nr:hypothetical protein [Actinoallomurus purpureus]MCO6009141.1 hypothetical protein [Actinoallomurus purpureus]